MKVWQYFHPDWGIVFKKIKHYTMKFAPSDVEFVDNKEDSDIQIVHVVGSGEYDVIKSCSRPVIWHQCYKTSGRFDWDLLWEKALLTVSFHYLPSYTNKKFNFLHLPLGYDDSLFYPREDFSSRPKNAFVTGHVMDTECIGVIYKACERAGYTLFHTGENFNLGSNYVYLSYMPENVYAEFLGRNIRYVFGLRRIEGFEIAALEGIASGAVGIVPNEDSYLWYDGLASMISTESPNLEENIYNILKNDMNFQINRNKLAYFTWDFVINKFWKTIYAYC